MSIISLDKDLFLFINGFAGKVLFFDSVVRLVVNEYFVPVSLALVILYLWFVPSKNQAKNQEVFPLAFFSLVVVNLIVHVSNLFIIRARPFDQLIVNQLFYEPTDPSFPSNAAAVGFVLAFSIWLVNRRLGSLALVLAAFQAFSRVYVGVHFPLDILAGAFLGVLVTWIVGRQIGLIEFTTDLTRRVQKRLRLSLD